MISIMPAFVPAYTAMILTTTITTGAEQPSHNQKESKHMITADIPKDTTFDLPEGTFEAQVTNLKPQIKQSASGTQDWIRFIFGVTVPGLSDKFITMAGRNFKLDLAQGSELRNWLTDLLGKEFFRNRSGQQVSFDSLVGMKCYVELEHFQGRGFAN